jgi:hypothetical protein
MLIAGQMLLQPTAVIQSATPTTRHPVDYRPIGSLLQQ